MLIHCSVAAVFVIIKLVGIQRMAIMHTLKTTIRTIMPIAILLITLPKVLS